MVTTVETKCPPMCLCTVFQLCLGVLDRTPPVSVLPQCQRPRHRHTARIYGLPLWNKFQTHWRKVAECNTSLGHFTNHLVPHVKHCIPTTTVRRSSALILGKHSSAALLRGVGDVYEQLCHCALTPECVSAPRGWRIHFCKAGKFPTHDKTISELHHQP